MDIEQLKQEIEESINNIDNLNQLNDLRVLYVGKKGKITELLLKLRELSNEEKKEYGKKVNDLRNFFQEKYDEIKIILEKKELEKNLDSEAIDITLPGANIKTGAPHILEKVIEDLEEFFISMGYDVVEGPEVEKDLYNFEMLNLPIGHPARDAQDTFYIEGNEILLRSQTSPVQVRTMLANTDKTPIRIICPGKTYRRDYDDASHSHQFMQIEALVVDKDITLSDLNGTLDMMAKHLFGSDTKTRFRPSYYPFTEPSVEYDVSCFNCHGKGCNVCKGTTWITIGGAGMVHPNVLKMSGYDPNLYQGFAFGFGIERIAMIKYGIPDLRYVYLNDLRGLKDFDRREDK